MPDTYPGGVPPSPRDFPRSFWRPTLKFKMSGETTCESCTEFVGDNDLDEADLLAIDLESIEVNVGL